MNPCLFADLKAVQKIIRCIYFSIALLASVNPLSAQLPSNPIGLNPTYLKWQQINTDKVQIIFPKGIESQAQRAANIIHYLWDHDNVTVGGQTKKVTIIFHNQTVIPNGFVTVAPFRSEFFMTPPQFDCTTNWLDLLTIHEYRHVKQFGNALRGPTRLARTLLGSWGWGGLMATALPRWYFEGDAVGTETALTRSGRGRLPAFDMEYRALLLEGKNFGYEKAGARSFKDFVPDWYGLGYYMTTYARREHGSEVLQDVITDAVRYKGLFYPFSKSMKRHTGLRTPQLYRATMDELAAKWQTEAEQLELTDTRPVNTKPKKTVINYTLPHLLEDGSVIAEKEGFDQIATFVKIDTSGHETRLCHPGLRLDPLNGTLSHSRGKLCWAEYNFDPRWRYQSFSVIRTYDMNSGKKEQLTQRSKYFSPVFSPTADRIAVVEINEQLVSQLVILDAADGSVLQRLPNPQQLIYSFPAWTADGDAVVVVAKANEQNFLLLIDLKSEKQKQLTTPVTHQITHPYVQGDTIYFAGAHTGINNIFALKIGEPKIYQLTSVLIGAFQPSVSADGKQLVFSSFSTDGYDIKKIELKDAMWTVLPEDRPSSIDFYEPLVAQSGGPILSKVSSDTFPVKKFNTWSNIIYPHSLLPYFTDPIAGLQLLADNKFSTLSGSAGAYYNYNDEDWTLLANLSYAELYPFINIAFARVQRSAIQSNFASFPDSSLVFTRYITSWQEDRITGGMSLPLNLSRGHYFTNLFLSTNYQHIRLNEVRGFENDILQKDTIGPITNLDEFEPLFSPPLSDTKLHAIDARFVFQSVRRQALQHLNPRLGIRLEAHYRTSLGGNLAADVLQLGSNIYLPGLSRNHSLYFNLAYKKEAVLDKYHFSDFFDYPRGYQAIRVDEVAKLGVNYSLPLWYPDIAIGPLAFVKRVKVNGFFDYGIYKNAFPFANEKTFSSTGAELSFDLRALRLLEVDLGVRWSYLFNENLAPNDKVHQFEFLVISVTE